jgi:hypothetical protein
VEEKTNARRILFGKPKGKKPLGRPRRRWQILKWILKYRMEECGLDLSGADRNQWRGLVNMVIKIYKGKAIPLQA